MLPQWRSGCDCCWQTIQRKTRQRSFFGRFFHRSGIFLRNGLGRRAGDAPSIDEAMRFGFNWELGPFEMWDAAGVRETVARMKALHLPVTRNVEDLLNYWP